MNILQVIPTLDSGGAERTTLEVAEAVARSGGRCVVASEGGRLEAELHELGGVLERLPLSTKNPLAMRANATRLARLISARDIDLVHARSRAPAWSALWAARRTGTPFVTTYHGTYNAGSAPKRLYNSVMARGDRVIANSGFIRDHLLAEHRIDPQRVTVIPRGVDLVRFDPAAIAPERVAAARARWNAAPDERVVLLPARITPWKGQALAIEAMARLSTASRLVFAGEAKPGSGFGAQLGAQAEAAGVQLSQPGHEADMPAALLAADVVINPSLEPEAFGRTAAEALAMGRPVIVADHGGAREVVEPGVTGWRVAPGDAAALAGAIEAALGLDLALREELAAQGRSRAERCFSKAALQESTLRVYREVLDWRP